MLFGMGPNAVRPYPLCNTAMANRAERGSTLLTALSLSKGRSPLPSLCNTAMANRAERGSTSLTALSLSKGRSALRVVGGPRPFILGVGACLRILAIQFPACRVRENVIADS